MEVKKASISASRQRLLEQMQALNHGRIRNILVRGGEPRLTPMASIERLVRFGGDNQPRAEMDLEDFALKSQVRELFECLDRMGEGLILKLEVKGGLPFDMIVGE